ncbi:MAG: ABC transporter ATP-binding protein [Planctomycetia bacterium]
MFADSNRRSPVRLEGVVKRYGRRTVLDGVSLEVPPGITGLVGPNGAGKSTLVRVILGLVQLAAGHVRVFGLDPARERRRVRGLLGVVPEDECTVPGLSGVEMVRYAALLCGLPGTESLRRAHEVLDWCDAGQERYRPVETLSVGTRQKVAFAAAIVHDPSLVILDEPTNGLDPLERRAMLGRLVTLARDHGKTVLVSTHVLPDVQAICERVVVLAGGRVRLSGTIEELTRPARPAHRIDGDGPLEPLLRRLAGSGLGAWTAADGGTGATALFVEPPGPDRVGLVWQAARDSGFVIRALEPVQRPLEEVFVATLRAAAAEAGVHHGAREVADAAS